MRLVRMGVNCEVTWAGIGILVCTCRRRGCICYPRFFVYFMFIVYEDMDERDYDKINMITIVSKF